jgi:hypothetical protein
LFKRQELSLNPPYDLIVPRLVIRRHVDFSFNEFFVISVPTLWPLEELLDGYGMRLDCRAHTSHYRPN